MGTSGTIKNILKSHKTLLKVKFIITIGNLPQLQCLKRRKNLWLVLFLVFAPFLSHTSEVSAQIVPDNTLPNNSIATPNGNLIEITGGTTAGNNLFHSFQDFSVLTGQTAFFDNGLTIQNILSRITGNSISNIDGLIRANGGANLFLINPNGIIFGENASLDIGGSFFVTTADGIKLGEDGFFSATKPENSQLLTVKPEVFFENALANAQGNIVNQGNLAVASRQTLSFLGTNVLNTGNLTAPGGIVGIFGSKSVALLENATIDVSSPTAGGTVLIGGDFQGLGTLPNAQRTYVGDKVTINADALTNGNGGRVIVWADEVTGFYGNINARGGVESGHGGFVEVSGKEHLIFRGQVNTSTVNGLPGTLLLDPTNIIIADGSGDEAGDGSDTFAGNNSGVVGSILSTPLSEIDHSAPTTIYESELEGLSGDTNIILQATNDITLQDLSDDSLELAAGAGVVAFSADADGNSVGDFVMEDNVADTIFTNGRDIAIYGAGLTIGNIDTSVLVVGDAGELIETALFVSDSPGGTLENISGNISGIEDVDLFQIYLTEGGNFSASTVGGSDTATQLFLFKADGKGIYTSYNEAGCNCFQATLPANHPLTPTEPGIYYLAISANGVFPVSEGELIFPSRIQTNDLESIDGATGSGGDLPLSSWVNEFGFNDGSYVINLTGVEAAESTVVESIQPIGDSGSITLNATNGNITAGNLNTTSSVADAGIVSLDASSNITMNDRIETSANIGIAGDVTLNAGGNITLNPSSSILSNGSLAGDITLNSQGDISIINSGIISPNVSQNESNSSSGNITMTANSIFLINGTFLSANTVGRGNSGLIKLIANDSISLTGENSLGGSSISSQVQRIGESASVNSAGIIIETNNLFISDGAVITTSTFEEGDAGAINIKASGVISLKGEDSQGLLPSGIISQVNPGAKGTAGDITIETTNLFISDGAVASTSTLGEGDAGAINIKASGVISIEGKNSQGSLPSGIVTQVNTEAKGIAGDITIETSNLFLSDGAIVSASTGGVGNAGNIIITTQNFNLDEGARVSTNTISSGQAGNIQLNIRDNLNLVNSTIEASTAPESTGIGGNIIIDPQSVTIQDGATIAVNSDGKGQGGSIELTAEKLTLKKGSITAETASNQGGNITLNIEDTLTFENSGEITAEAGTAEAGGNGGDITINADFILAFPADNNYEIIAKAFEGDGGNIKLTTNSFFGREFVNISASSQFGIDGDVSIDILEVNPAQSLTELPANVIDASQQISQACTPEDGESGRFVATGRGGLPLSPNEPLRGTAVITNWVDEPTETTGRVTDRLAKNLVGDESISQIVEAQRWIINDRGNLELVAQPPANPAMQINVNCDSY
ncbi:MAG: filamentous hemagglutinin N-terminal domain-containing protein [Xenococcaceae cyanobacterium MO_167.B27]|nr:filamentous hemagglutinin N-terminal domain-containing protein [Xenococcaceae cyanobacterium MO_167.B27]